MSSNFTPYIVLKIIRFVGDSKPAVSLTFTIRPGRVMLGISTTTSPFAGMVDESIKITEVFEVRVIVCEIVCVMLY